ncbi:MAG: hypothetical protein C0404_04405 [Verrucomicrobia bacterium]|nr:hypothetical protein [Verrucomicrobiota bacterium]
MNSESQSDSELLERYVKSGDTAAFDAIYKKYAGLVYSVCLRYLRVAQDAEDAVTACFVVLMNKAGTITDRSKLMTWLYSCALKTSRNAARLRQHRMEREHKAYDEEVAGKEGRVMDWNAVLPNVEIEIEKLPAEQREALLLHFYGGLSRSALALKLQCAEGTVAARIARGLKTLRKRLRTSGAELSEHTILSGMTGSALILPVPYSLTLRLAAIGKGETITGVVTEIVQATMRSFMWARVKVAAAIVGAIAVPSAIAAVAVFGPLHKEDVSTMPVAPATVVAQAEVVYEDEFEGDKLDPFWEIVRPASQVAVDPSGFRSRMVFTAAGPEFNRRTGSSYTSVVEVISRPIAYRAGEVLEIAFDHERAQQDSECARFFSSPVEVAGDSINLVDGANNELSGNIIARENMASIKDDQQSGGRTLITTEPETHRVYYLYRGDRALVLNNSSLFLFSFEKELGTVKLIAKLWIKHPMAKANFPVERVSVRRLKALPKEMEARLKAMTGNKADLRP